MEILLGFNPATGQVIWEGAATNDIDARVNTARNAFFKWSKISLSERIHYLETYAKRLAENDFFPEAISKATGKPLWESKTEVKAMIDKIPLSIEAYKERCSQKQISADLSTEFRPYGVVAVFGPYNFPGHLPNGHIVPALLAGNTVLFKPSELTPSIGVNMQEAFRDLPKGVFQLVQGGPEVGRKLASSSIDGIYFTGSAQVGTLLQEQKGKILALEMGGNNPLIISKIEDVKAAAYMTIQSAFLTTGQRCSAARRLILTPDCPKEFIDELLYQMNGLVIGAYNDPEEPFMGPLIHVKAAANLLQVQEVLKTKGANILNPLKQIKPELPFVTPALIDVTNIETLDVEYFGPFLQLIRTSSLEEAIHEANRTSYGLTAGLFSESGEEWASFYSQIRAGIINLNAPLTGASSKAPFGGLGMSGNYRPSGYLAADYCSYPIASLQMPHLKLPSSLTKGIHL